MYLTNVIIKSDNSGSIISLELTCSHDEMKNIDLRCLYTPSHWTIGDVSDIAKIASLIKKYEHKISSKQLEDYVIAGLIADNLAEDKSGN